MADFSNQYVLELNTDSGILVIGVSYLYAKIVK